MARRAKKPPEEPPEGNFDLLFLQLMMIMMAFFILLSSLSVVVEDRRQKALNSLAGAFSLMPAGANLGEGKGRSIPSREIGASNSTAIRTAKDLTNAAKLLGAKHAIHVLPLDMNRVLVRLPERLLFKPGQIKLSPKIISFLKALAGIMRRPEVQEIIVEGHTDEVPARGSRFASNWELSAARAMQIFHKLAAIGIPRSRMAVAGMGDAHPIPGAGAGKDRAKNRRVELLIRFHPTTARNANIVAPKTKASPDMSSAKHK